jgi:hypothetical protein
LANPNIRVTESSSFLIQPLKNGATDSPDAPRVAVGKSRRCSGSWANRGAACRLNSAAEIKEIVDFLGLLIELFLQSAAGAVTDNRPDWATVVCRP